ncbi:CDP-alcohol phosphatidyltransferase family protein [Candidatus Gottesmanbacteria bacterium]|nr:CDP-alcohol phosphatidyltransferase family protein [Candidatus Gottesmanbacteria bacterium]
MGLEQQPSPIHVVSETRNSPLREMSSGAIQFVVNRLHEAFPDLTPNHLTLLGVVGVATASTLLTLRKGNASSKDKALTAVSFFSLVVSAIGDGLDGTLARTSEAENPGSMNPEIGQLLDVLADRTGENAMAFSRAFQAHKKHNRLGVTLALIEAITSSLPSLMRAFDEKEGHRGPEIPPGLFGFAGTRFGRTALGIASTVLPEIRDVPVQELF